MVEDKVIKILMLEGVKLFVIEIKDKIKNKMKKVCKVIQKRLKFQMLSLKIKLRFFNSPLVC